MDSVTYLKEQHQSCQLGYEICVTLCHVSSKPALAREVPLASVAAGPHHLPQASGHGHVLEFTAREDVLPLGNVQIHPGKCVDSGEIKGHPDKVGYAEGQWSKTSSAESQTDFQ